MEQEQLLEISPNIGSVHVLWNHAVSAQGAISLAHGAGAGMHHAFMQAIAERWAALGFHVLRFQFPYMEVKSPRTDRPPVAIATIKTVVEYIHKSYPQLPVFAAGKSFGARMSSMYAAEVPDPPIRGLIYLGYPLHAAGKPSLDRSKHLPEVTVPQLFMQGERDTLAEIPLIRQVCQGLPLATLLEYPMADHSFKRPKKSGYTQEETLDLLAQDAVDWITRLNSENA